MPMTDDMIDATGFILAGMDIPEGVRVIRYPAPLRGMGLVYREKMLMIDLATAERHDTPGVHSIRWATAEPFSGQQPVRTKEKETTALSDVFDAVADFLADAREANKKAAPPEGACSG